MSIQDEIQRLRAAGIETAREMRHALTVPQRTYEQRTETVEKDADTIAFETKALAMITQFMEIVTGNSANVLQRLGAITTTGIIDAINAAVARGGIDRTNAAFIGAQIIALFVGAKERGYTWPLPPHFGQSSFDKVGRVVVESASIMEREGENLTIEQVKELMT